MFKRRLHYILSVVLPLLSLSSFLVFSIPASAGGGDPIDEYWLTGLDFSDTLGNNGNFILAQSFTPVRTYDLVSIDLMLERQLDTSPLNVNVALRAVDSGGLPTGPDLAFCVVNCDSLPLNSVVTQNFTFSTQYKLLAGSQYCFIAYSVTNSAIRVYGEEFPAFSDDDYRGGAMIYSTDGGSTWLTIQVYHGHLL